MDRFIVAALGVAGLTAALAMLAAFRDTTREAAAFDVGDSTWDRTRVLLSRGAGGLAGSLLAGVLVMGLGGRLMMRVIAATSTDGVQGAITDMDAVVGEVTTAGTLGFVLFAGLGSGYLAWVGRLLLRRWLPGRSIAAGLMAACIGAGLFARGTSLLAPDNVDFSILSPTWLAVVMIIGLIATFAMLQAVLSDRWSQGWPTTDRKLGLVGLTPLALLLPLPPFALGTAVATLARARVGDVDPRTRWVSTADRVGRTLVGVAAVLGGAWVAAGAVEILLRS
jgi:hypothetical protein